MKKSALITILATLMAGQALAAEPSAPPAGVPPHGKPPLQHLFDDSDANKDGQLSKAEWVARGEKMFAEIDANKDGNVTTEEMKAHHESKRAEMEKNRVHAGGKPEGKPPVDAPTLPEKH